MSPFRLEFFRLKASSVEKTRVSPFKLEFFRPTARPGEKTHGELFKLRVCSTRSTFRASRARSSSFLVRVAPQRVAGHPEAKSGQNLIRNGLLEAILEASWPASKPASQAQPLARDFSMPPLPWATCNPFGANLDEKTRRSRLRVHLVEKTRAWTYPPWVFDVKY